MDIRVGCSGGNSRSSAAHGAFRRWSSKLADHNRFGGFGGDWRESDIVLSTLMFKVKGVGCWSSVWIEMNNPTLSVSLNLPSVVQDFLSDAEIG